MYFFNTWRRNCKKDSEAFSPTYTTAVSGCFRVPGTRDIHFSPLELKSIRLSV
jgi:uracil-DNA glycosylase